MSSSLLSAAACLLGLFGLPAWATFIGWAWYIALNIKGMKFGIVVNTVIASVLIALFAIIVTDALSIYLPNMFPGMIVVFIAILGLMIWLKVKEHSSLVGFNSFSCIFAGYYLQGFPVQDMAIFFNLFVALLSITGCNIIGLLVGWLNACWCLAAQSSKEEIKAIAQAKANGTMMYYALARLAKEQGYDDMVDKFIEAANQEAIHAGFYSVLNGKYPQNFWNLLRTIQKAEENGEAQIKALADKVRAAGFVEAADEMEVFAKQEGHHGVLMQEILDEYQPKFEVPTGKKVYVCPVCGYEYIGDINAEPDDYVCPLCSQPKSAFQEKK